MIETTISEAVEEFAAAPLQPAIPQPRTVLDLGIRKNLLQDLALKILHLEGEMTLLELAQHMRVSLSVMDEIFPALRREYCEVKGMVGNIHLVALTTMGKSRALELLANNQYVGPAPVTLADYTERVRAQSVRGAEVGPPDVALAFSHLVLSQPMLAQLGTAAVSGRAIFLYGPTGTGKTSIAEALPAIYSDSVWVPYAVEAQGQIIALYDPAVHRPTGEAVPRDHDTRWVQCRRPRVIAGGELTMDMLDLTLDRLTHCYLAPLQLKANNGVLIIDDFGRQRISPEELLNRWMVPLDRRADYLALGGGAKFEVPFDVLVVFATNLDPARLADEAFLRRIQNKIKVDPLTPSEFHEVFRACCQRHSLPYDDAVGEHVIELLRSEFEQPLRPCYPGDLINLVVSAARYEGTAPKLDRGTVTQACRNYFLRV